MVSGFQNLQGTRLVFKLLRLPGTHICAPPAATIPKALVKSFPGLCLRNARSGFCTRYSCVTARMAFPWRVVLMWSFLCPTVTSTGGPITDPEAAWHGRSTQRVCPHAELHPISHREDALLCPRELPDTRWRKVSPVCCLPKPSQAHS